MPHYQRPETKIADDNNTFLKKCTKCDEFKALKEFRRQATGYLGFRAACRICEQKYRDDNREAIREYGRKYWIEKSTEKYGISLEKYNELTLDGCMICGRKDLLHIDHDHKTGKFRGILCINCNTGIGSFFDDTDLMLKAASYLESRKENKDALI